MSISQLKSPLLDAWIPPFCLASDNTSRESPYRRFAPCHGAAKRNEAVEIGGAGILTLAPGGHMQGRDWLGPPEADGEPTAEKRSGIPAAETLRRRTSASCAPAANRNACRVAKQQAARCYLDKLRRVALLVGLQKWENGKSKGKRANPSRKVGEQERDRSPTPFSLVVAGDTPPRFTPPPSSPFLLGCSVLLAASSTEEDAVQKSKRELLSCLVEKPESEERDEAKLGTPPASDSVRSRTATRTVCSPEIDIPALAASNIHITHTMSPKQSDSYYLVPNLQAMDPSARELDPNAHTWIQPIIIEDEDLMFGGKSLSAWYEEDRSRLSSSSSSNSSDDGNQSPEEEEERRGRERTRRHHDKKALKKPHRK
ncbi:hypothetical protein TARUN_7562 [Trichoderma arundinaceum]|uniref:Uncharacterized protein n=1 Tax=Trichoderma arundinaceum TaxID=490622 RepID=A0A395NEZ0_TRIAR|nr:hypothetical protein TARUN_7562 [Trichoderma arundinaceum]